MTTLGLYLHVVLMKDQLAQRIKSGDEQSFELFYRKYYSRLCQFACKFLKEPEEAREIVQSVFVKLWEDRSEIDPVNSLSSYIFKITQNNCINKLRHHKVESKYIEIYKIVYVDNHEISPFESLIGDELNERINKIIDRLPPECRKIFSLSRIEGLKYSEIAVLLGISVKTVEAQMSKALQILRTGLKDHLGIIVFLITLIPISFTN